MTKNEFIAFCETHQLQIGFVHPFTVALIIDDDGFNAIQPLLTARLGHLVSVRRKVGEHAFDHRTQVIVYANTAAEAKRVMADQFDAFLQTQDDAWHYSVDRLEQRDQLLVAHPQQGNESLDAHFNRVCELTNEVLAPRHVNQPGFWDVASEQIILPDTEHEAGLWSFRFDNWSQHLVFVFTANQ